MGNLIGRAREAEELNRLYISDKYEHNFVQFAWVYKIKTLPLQKLKIYDKEGAVENFAGAHKT